MHTFFGIAAALALLGAQGESPAQTNIPTASHPKASAGRYLALDTAAPPPRRGWYATYRVRVPRAGVYRLDAVLTSPAMPDRDPKGGSYFDLSVNGAPFTQVAGSEPYWANFANKPPAWGSLVKARLPDVELRRGINRITFRVRQPRVSSPPVRYRFFLDRFTLKRTRLAIAGANVGDRGISLGIYRAPSAPLRFRLNGHARRPERVRYRILDYHSREVGRGTARIAAGTTAAAVRVRGLRPGYYRVTAALASEPRARIAGSFARLPARRPVAGPASRFGVTTSAPWLVPPARLDAVAVALKEAGVSAVRDEIDWSIAEARRGAYDTSAVDSLARAFRRHGIATLGALWSLTGNNAAPAWAMTDASAPLPADLRDGYRLTRHLAGRTDGIGSYALELWNEPELDVINEGLSRGTGDQLAAYLKAAAIGIADSPGRRPLIALPGIFEHGPYQDLMLQNGVLPYADVWSYHSYPYLPLEPKGLMAFPPQSAIQHRLRRLHGATTQMWTTEAGTFATPKRGGELNAAEQRAQARFLVQSTVQDLAAGSDRRFWFSGPPYCAGGFACFGLFSGDFQPWPSYSAHAAMTALLGEANFAHRLRGVPAKAFLFEDRGRAVTVLWARSPRRVSVPVSGRTVALYDTMGARRRAAARVRHGRVRVTASLDPTYVVSAAPRGLRARRPASSERRAHELTAGDRVVLAQRFPARARPKPPPGFGYRLGASTRMAVEVYNFNDAPQTVAVSGRAWGGWTVSGPQTAVVPPMGRVSVPFTVTAAAAVRRRVDYPLLFEASSSGAQVPPSVARVQRRGGKRDKPVRLIPSITALSHRNGAKVTGDVELTARVVDALSGVDPERVTVAIDGRPVESRFDAATGRLSTTLRLPRGKHTVSVRAVNRARAVAEVRLHLTREVRG